MSRVPKTETGTILLIFLAWFAADPAANHRARRARERVDAALSDLTPHSYARRDIGGTGWGIAVWHPADEGQYRWPSVADDGDVTAISIGIPVGICAGSTPAGLTRRLLAGDDVHADVVPPFGLIAVDRATQRVVLQQDWLGMSRLFSGSKHGLTAFSNRPTLLAELIAGKAKPSPAGWTSYAVTGHFGGDLSPVEGVRLMRPGERMKCQADPGGWWRVDSEPRRGLDDLVRDGLAARGDGVEAAIDSAAEAFRETVQSVRRLYDAPVTLGLSGGKDSRIIAASFIAADHLPTLVTHNDLAEEGEIASHLVDVLRRTRRVRVRHTIKTAGAPAQVLDVGLHERAQRLHRTYDFQFPASYLARPAVPAQLRPRLGPVSVTGAAGEIATGYWYPSMADESQRAVVEATQSHMMRAMRSRAATPAARRMESDRIEGILAHAASLGLSGSEQIDYVYLMERVRRWSSAAYNVGVVTPFLTPSVVTAAFALTADQKRARVLHNGLLRRFLPEWSDVPYLSATPAPSRATRVWDGDGVATIRRLLTGRALAGIDGIIRTEVVEAAVEACEKPDPPLSNQGTLQSFVSVAVAAQAFAEQSAPSPIQWRTQLRQRLRRALVPAQRTSRPAGAAQAPRPDRATDHVASPDPPVPVDQPVAVRP